MNVQVCDWFIYMYKSVCDWFVCVVCLSYSNAAECFWQDQGGWKDFHFEKMPATNCSG